MALQMTPVPDYGELIQSGMNLVPDLQRRMQMLAQTQALGAQARESDARVASFDAEQQRKQQFAEALRQSDGSPASVSRLIMQFPEFADEMKKGWDVQDKAATQASLSQLGGIYSATLGNDWALAAKTAHAAYDAQVAAGRADPAHKTLLDMMDKAAAGDTQAQGMTKTMLGSLIASATGPEHFGTVYGALNKGDEEYTLNAGAARFRNGKMVAHSPFIEDATGGIRAWTDGQTGGGYTASPDMNESVASVANTLSGELPHTVVAGFLGNFHVEGGYTGAKGDGGSAHGIGQWRGERVDNFKRIIGKAPTEATPAEQAKFVLWEMQNPEAAGMTVQQRDKILAAKTPAQAAALIDQFYERSSGKHRKGRMEAANAFAQLNGGGGTGGASKGAFPVLIPGKEPEQKDTFSILTPAEAQAQGLDPNMKFQRNNRTGQITPLGGQNRQVKQIPQQVQTKLQPSIDIRDTMTRLTGSFKSDYGGHTITGGALNSVQGLIDVGPEGMRDWWADFKSMDNQVRNQLFGSALTEHEKKAYEATTITPRMSPAQIKKNLARRLSIVKAATTRQQAFLKKNGYDPEAVDALFQPLGGGGNDGNNGGPVRVRSIQEARKLPSGTLFITPDGHTLRKR